MQSLIKYSGFYVLFKFYINKNIKKVDKNLYDFRLPFLNDELDTICTYPGMVNPVIYD